jgi:hypothetical protein
MLTTTEEDLAREHRRRLWRRIAEHAVTMTIGTIIGAMLGFLAADPFRWSLIESGSPVRLTSVEGRVLSAAHGIDAKRLSALSLGELTQRLSLSAEALRLSVLLDGLPKPEAADAPTWWKAASPGRLGGAEALAAMAEMLAAQTPDRRQSAVFLLEEFGRAPIELRSLLIWASLLPEPERVRLRSLNSGVLSTEKGRTAFFTLAGASREQFSQCQEATKLATGTWQQIQRIVQRPEEDLAMLSRIAGLPAARRGGLFDVVGAYEGPAQGHREAPYPCLDRPSYGWHRSDQPVRTCTVALP